MSESASRDRLKLELRRAAGPFLLYLLLLIGGLLVGADIIRNLSGDKPWISYNTYQAAFTNVKNVVPGQVELRIAGVKVGSIADSRLVNGHPVLTLHLESKYAPIYRDAVMRIRPVTPLEDMYVNIISRGHSSAGVLGPNDVLPVTQTDSAVEVSSVLDVLSADTRARFATMLDELGRGLSPNGGAALRSSFEAISPFLLVAKQMSAALAQRRVELMRLIHNFGGITQELALRDTQLQSFVRNANTTLGALANSSGPLNATLAQIPPTLRSMSSAFGSLRAAEDSLDPALTSLRPVAAALPRGLDALGQFSKEATPALVALRPAIRDLKPLAQTLQKTSSPLKAAFRTLRPQAPQIDRMTKLAAVPSCLTYMGQFFNNVISMTKFGFGQGNIAIARAHVVVDFHSLGALSRDPAWKISPICYLQTGASK